MLKFAALALATLTLSASFARPDDPDIGKAAPEIDATTWFNQLGAAPNLASLRGSAVMIEFWATW
jgi:hypothetical protein